MCDCVKNLDVALAEHNGRVSMALTLSADMSKMGARVLIATEKLDAKKRKPIPALMAAYCPFCGTKWCSDETPNA